MYYGGVSWLLLYRHIILVNDFWLIATRARAMVKRTEVVRN